MQNCGPSAGRHLHHNQANNHATTDISTGIFLDHSGGCDLDHNVCNGNLGTGIYLGAAPNCSVEHNEANNNGLPHSYNAGIGLDMSPDCKVAHNVANGNRMFGIAVARSCGTVFNQNSAYGNEAYDLFAPDWYPDTAPPSCNSYRDNRGATALPSLEFWDVK